MPKETYREGLTISALERMPSSANANPRYRVVFTDGTSAPTGVDASVAYGIGNSNFRDVPLWVTFNEHGHITYIEPMKGRGGNG